MSIAHDWAKQYARQADADFKTYHHFQGKPEIPQCHKLQFLQMACEKLVKAHLCKGGGVDPKTLEKSHAYVAGTLPVVLREQLIVSQLATHRATWVMDHIRLLAGEIDVLAPAVRRGGVRPDNCEYPWPNSRGNVVSPLDWTFKPSQLLFTKAGTTFLKLVLEAIKRFQ